MSQSSIQQPWGIDTVKDVSYVGIYVYVSYEYVVNVYLQPYQDPRAY